MAVVIKVEQMSKRYRLGSIDRGMLYEDAQRFWAWLRGKEDPFTPVNTVAPKENKPKEIWALRDVNMEIRDGDVVGIIGRNGSGKSTLLKILSKITAPTKGRALIRGRVASLLEVGTGFHSELTGRENVYMNAAILGMTKSEIDRRFDEIVDFSGVEKFIDTPVKRYSSGMMVRLAFAVAAHLEPEILIVDEVLAVGDSAFQQKCLGRMSSVAKEGRTILFVSHQAAAVENLCRRGIVLGSGEVKFDGTQTDAISYYANSIANRDMSLRDRSDRGGSGAVRIVALEFRATDGRVVSTVNSGQDVDICFFYENYSGQSFPRLSLQIHVTTKFEAPVFMQYNRLMGQRIGPIGESGAIVCRIDKLPLPPSSYWITLYLTAEDGRDHLDDIVNAADLVVESGDFFGTGEMPSVAYGVSLVTVQWRTEPGLAPTAIQTLPSPVEVVKI